MADRSRLLDRATEAFLDGAPVTWSDLLRYSRDHRERRLLHTMQRLERVRGELAVAPAPRRERLPTVAARAIVVVAAVQTATCVFLLLVPEIRAIVLSTRIYQVILALAFSLASIVLFATRARDARRIHLVAAFACAAAAFARSAVHDLWPDSPLAYAGPTLERLFLEALTPACLWQFARRRPSRQRFTALDRAARLTARLTWLAGILLVGVNLLAPRSAPPLVGVFLRGHESSRYWQIFALMAVPAVAAIWLRARATGPFERHRVSRLASAVAAGGVPFLLSGIKWSTQPSMGHDTLSWAALHGWWDHLVVAALAVAPMLCAAAAIAERPFDLDLHVRQAWQALTARLAHRPSRHARRAGRHARDLSDTLEWLRLCRGTREIAVAIEASLRRTLDLDAVHVLVPSAEGALVALADAGAALPHGSALVDLVRTTPGAIDVAAESRLRRLLPGDDRRWLVDHAVTTMAAVRLRDDTLAAIAALGRRNDGQPLDRRDRWLVEAVVAAAASAWDADRTVAAVSGPSLEEPGFECPRCGSVADTPLLACGCSDKPRLAALPVVLGQHFLVERRLAAGGMGVVYLARDLRLGRQVALKALPRLSTGAAARFDNEARAMAALSHAGLATLFGVERWRGTPVLIVEYLAGGTLADRLADGPLPPRSAIAVVSTLASALAYMHARGMLHRDLKPTNIGFTGEGAAKLLDFGLASFSHDDVAPSRTSSRRVAGTPAYLAPEAFDGAAASEAFDRWALAVVLLEAVTGAHPFRRLGRLNAMNGHARLNDLLTAHGASRLAPFCQRALAIDPSARFQTTDDFAVALARVLLGDGESRE